MTGWPSYINMDKNFLKTILILSVLILFPFGRASAVYDAETDKFLGIINAYRVGNGHASLSGDALLQNAANWMSEDMILNCVSSMVCSHTDSLGRTLYDRLQSFDYLAGSTNGTLRGGEIIAWGSGGLSTAEKAFGMWKNSPTHNENMLRDTYNAVGISRSCAGKYCAWVTDFGGKVVQSFVYSPYLPSPTSLPAIMSTPVPSITPIPTPIVASTPLLTPVPTMIPVPTRVPISTPIVLPTPQIVINIPGIESSNEGPLRNSQNFPDGALIRQNGGIDVYIIKYVGAKKFKRLILNPSVFANYGHLKWSDIKDIDRLVLDSFITSDLVRAVGDPKVYKLNALGDTGEKRWIKTAENFIQSGFDWDAIYEINSYDRDSYITGANWL
jgi:hypothetical protein